MGSIAAGISLSPKELLGAVASVQSSARQKVTATVRDAFLYPPTESLRKVGYYSWPGIPQTGGCRTNIEMTINEIDDVCDVKGMHQIIFYGNYARQLRIFCQLYGIEELGSRLLCLESTAGFQGQLL
ncbi:MAG: hypothetical protein ACYSUB_23165 [Planctomycetota bacterium]